MIEEYIQEVKSQLTCNQTELNKEHITYNYSENEIDNHLDYFKHCLSVGLSAYKSLLFFHDYLNGEYSI